MFWGIAFNPELGLFEKFLYGTGFDESKNSCMRFVSLLWVKVVIDFQKFPAVIHCYLMLCAEWSCTRSTRPPMMPMVTGEGSLQKL